MKAKDHATLNAFSRRIRQYFPEARIWAFGSRVREDGSQHSDLDVCIVLNLLDEKADAKIMEIAWEIGFENDLVISTVTFSREEFEKGPCSQSMLVKNILDHGIAA